MQRATADATAAVYEVLRKYDTRYVSMVRGGKRYLYMYHERGSEEQETPTKLISNTAAPHYHAGIDIVYDTTASRHEGEFESCRWGH